MLDIPEQLWKLVSIVGIIPKEQEDQKTASIWILKKMTNMGLYVFRVWRPRRKFYNDPHIAADVAYAWGIGVHSEDYHDDD